MQFSGCPLAKAKKILVLLHGFGASGNDLLGLAEQIGGDSRAFVFPQAPFSQDSGGFAWATNEQEFKASRSRVIAMLDYIAVTYPDAKISVGGFSQGANIASTLISESQFQFEHLILYSPGFAIDEYLPKTARGPTVFLSHGREDDLLPFAGAERLRKTLTDLGLKVNWQPFSGGHTITTELLEQTRKQLDE